MIGPPGSEKCAVTLATLLCMGLGNQRMSDMPQLGYIIRGIKRATRGTPRTTLPITLELLRVLRESWSSQMDKQGAMWWAAAYMCFFNFLRCGEVVMTSGISFDPPGSFILC